MSLSESGRLEALVVDTGALVRGENLQPLADRFFTLTDVLSEVRDKKTRQRLECLPFKLEVREPSKHAVETIVRFAKATGDLAVLSKPDIRVMALAYMLHVELHGGDQNLRKSPLTQSSTEPNKGDSQPAPSVLNQQVNTEEKQVTTSAKVKPGISWASALSKATSSVDSVADDSVANNSPFAQEKAVEAAVESNPESMWDDSDFEAAANPEVQKETNVTEEPEAETEDWPSLPAASAPQDDQSVELFQKRNEERIQRQRKQEELKKQKEIEEALALQKLEQLQIESSNSSEENLNNSTSRIIGASDVYVDEGNIDDDGLGWINESNLEDALAFNSLDGRLNKNNMGEKMEEPKVGCVTTDYAMQNVMLQMKLHVVSLEGRKVTTVRRFVLKCDACYKICHKLDKIFCPSCGNNTLARLSYSIDSNGQHRYHYKKNRRVNTRGTKYSMPSPHKKNQGKAKGKTLLLREDQLMSGWWGQQARKKTSANSMFGEHVTESFGLSLTQRGEGIKVGYGRTNKNSQRGRERRGKKKKNNN